MSRDPKNTALMAYLNSKGTVYHGKALELREVIENWLAYIPLSFPHYTRHTVRHSDEIILQISKLLFKDEYPAQILIPLSPVEIYILVAGAYLHDAGMVAADREKIEIISSDEWKEWISGEGGGTKRWNEIQELRKANEPEDDMLRHFLADLQTRFLIAEFIRRVHHLRAVDVIDQHQSMLGRFAFDDPLLQRTIASICVAHGLRTHELEDQERFPERRDIRGYAVNVRLMAILLRLGDLLDMTCDRACPLLLNAACPLPANSLAHWTQYQRITHRLTAPDRIEITAECHDQDEHRLLQDWCQWIVDEVHNARILLSRSTRHRGYELPTVRIDTVDATINIRPASTATYFPSEWAFELDHEAVFQRLIYDVYDSSAAFIRELIQNALDACRCQMYSDLIRDGISPPEYPTQVDEGRRSRYPIQVSLRTIEVQNRLSGEMESRQVLIVNDYGIGMDKQIIQRYFLQVGRSFYTTDEFRRSYRFIPTSRFGVGFLSVFAVSDKVSVDTYKPSSPSKDGPIRLTLTGPRNYLLTERGARRSAGTEIEVLLREPMVQGQLTKLITDWCKRVEFPIIVQDLGAEFVVTAERHEQFTYEIPDLSKEDSLFVVRTFQVNRPGIEGELYVFARVDNTGEAWDRFYWARETYPQNHPQATKPEFPTDLICLHGISIQEGESSSWRPMRARLDYRGDFQHLTLSRISNQNSKIKGKERDHNIVSRWEEILTDHLAESPFANSEDGWKYKQRLVDNFDLPLFWSTLPRMIPIYRNGQLRLLPLTEVLVFPMLRLILRRERIGSRFFSKSSKTSNNIALYDSDIPALLHFDELSYEHRKAILEVRLPTTAQWINNSHLAVDWEMCGEEKIDFVKDALYTVGIVDLPDRSVIGFAINELVSGAIDYILLNINHPIVEWLISVKRSCEQCQFGLKPEQFKNLMSLLSGPIRYEYDLPKLIKYIDGWRSIPNLPSRAIQFSGFDADQCQS